MSDKALQIKISEADLQTAIVDLAHLYGWHVAHFRPAMTTHGWRTPVSADGKGFPDLCMVKGNKLIFWEVKSGRQLPSKEQTEWLERLSHIDGVTVGVVYPDNWDCIYMTLSEGSDIKIEQHVGDHC